jgi:peroxiredoxin
MNSLRQTLSLLLLCLATGPLAADSASDATPPAADAVPAVEPAPPPFKVAASAAEIAPLKPGAIVPEATVFDLKGEPVQLQKHLAGRNALVIFYRGGWCPYCNTHLAELAGMRDELEAKGIAIIALSPDSPDHLAEALGKREYGFTLLSDKRSEAASGFGVAFAVDDATDERLKGYGIDLTERSGEQKRILPVPAVFLVDGSLSILFAHTNPDYSKRLSAAALREAIAASPLGETKD